jgi:phage terminase small subunit
MTEQKLTTKQRLFVEAYLANPNATDAARRAGYKGNDVTLGAVGAENLKKPLIAEMLEKRVNEAIVTADEVLRNVKILAQTAERDGDRLKGWELLGKHLAMWIDKSEGKVDVSVSETNVVRPAIPDAVTDDINGYSN